MSLKRLVTHAVAAALLVASAGAASASTPKSTDAGCIVDGPDLILVYQQYMPFSVTVDPNGVTDWDGQPLTFMMGVDLYTSDQSWTDYASMQQSGGVFKGYFKPTARYDLRYGTMYEELDDFDCGYVRRPITVKAKTRSYISSSRSGSYVRINGTVDYYDKDYVNWDGPYYGAWRRKGSTYLDFQRWEGGRWVTKKSVLTDSRGNATTGWMKYSTSSSWRVQYRGGWWLGSSVTGAVSR